MPRRKQQSIPTDYYGSLDYGMDEYDDPIDSMSPEEIRRLADYVEMIQGGRYTDNFEDDSDEDDDQANYEPPPDPLYPGDYTDDSDDEN